MNWILLWIIVKDMWINNILSVLCGSIFKLSRPVGKKVEGHEDIPLPQRQGLFHTMELCWVRIVWSRLCAKGQRCSRNWVCKENAILFRLLYHKKTTFSGSSFIIGTWEAQVTLPLTGRVFIQLLCYAVPWCRFCTVCCDKIKHVHFIAVCCRAAPGCIVVWMKHTENNCYLCPCGDRCFTGYCICEFSLRCAVLF